MLGGQKAIVAARDKAAGVTSSHRRPLALTAIVTDDIAGRSGHLDAGTAARRGRLAHVVPHHRSRQRGPHAGAEGHASPRSTCSTSPTSPGARSSTSAPTTASTRSTPSGAGAARVLATDSWTWNWPGSRRPAQLRPRPRGARQPGRDQVVSPSRSSHPSAVGGTFDVVLFLGVLYHAPDPIGYLRRVRSVTGDVAVIETAVDLLDVPVPAAAYYPGAALGGDASNHFGPNALCVARLADGGRVQPGRRVRTVAHQHTLGLSAPPRVARCRPRRPRASSGGSGARPAAAGWSSTPSPDPSIWAGSFATGATITAQIGRW